ncbi:GRP family sugar transporter [Enterococcus sp. BWT-B8]|uniref:GRP family sugar transporter n=1 Tax=Enterococcus sp. BWT-B8 TaxID=2885157 RepID=UPI001E56DBB2|nr:GRP family sugar transporter [Enterococcus sp. BWT-B8]MCB5952081.1 GRP family sugar transporter [Enterococcus sp. BWT-B8]
MDILLALVPMFAWGSIGLVSGRIGGDANQQTLGMTIGAGVLSVIIFILMRPVIMLPVIVVGLLSGLLWSVGQNQQFHAMKFLGVSVGLPISTGLQLIVNTIAGAVFFREWKTNKDFVLGLTALGMLISGAYLTVRRDQSDDRPVTDGLPAFGKGLRAVVISTAGYCAYTIMINAAGLDPLAIIFPQSIGMLAGAGFFAFKKTKVDSFVWKNTVSGLLWGLGNICMLLTMQQIGLAVSFSLSQMGIIISTIGGIFILKEAKTKKEIRFVIYGCLLIIAGGVLLGYMKA